MLLLLLLRGILPLTCVLSILEKMHNLLLFQKWFLWTPHTVADIVALVDNELPLHTGATFQEAQSAEKLIFDNALRVDNLELLAFLSSAGKVLNIDDVNNLETRPADITFVKFCCIVDGSSSDKRITGAKPVSFQVCLRLPQYL